MPCITDYVILVCAWNTIHHYNSVGKCAICNTKKQN